MFNEDVMVRTVHTEKVNYTRLVAIDMRGCHCAGHFRSHEVDLIWGKVIVFHHVREEVYDQLKEALPESSISSRPVDLIWITHSFAVASCE